MNKKAGAIQVFLRGTFLGEGTPWVGKLDFTDSVYDTIVYSYSRYHIFNIYFDFL